MESIEKCLKNRKGEGSTEERWKELRNVVVSTAEETYNTREYPI